MPKVCEKYTGVIKAFFKSQAKRLTIIKKKRLDKFIQFDVHSLDPSPPFLGGRGGVKFPSRGGGNLKN